MARQKRTTVYRPRTAGGFLAYLAITLATGWACTAIAQEAAPEFGIAPAANTQRTISDAPTVSSVQDEGLYAALGVAYSHRSNVRRSSVAGASGEGDSAVVFTPQAGYKHGFGRHSAEVGIVSQFTNFKDLSDENTGNYTAHALANLDLTRILDLDVFASFTRATEPRGGSGTPDVQSPKPDKLNITGYGGQVTIGQRSSTLQFEVGADRSEWRYKNNQQEFRDRDYDRLHGRVYYNISPRTSLFVGAGVSDVNFVNSAGNSDSQELHYEAGGRWDITAKTTGSVSVGRTEKDFDNPALADPTTTTFGGRLSWTPRPQRTSFSLYGSRQFEEAAVASDAFYTSELVGASVRQAIGSRLDAFGYVNHTNDDYDSGRTDKILDYGIGLDYAFRRWLSVGTQYSVVDRNSNVPGNDYTDEIVSLYLNVNGGFRVGTR